MKYDKLKKKIAGLIRLYRKNKGFSRRELADEINVSYDHIKNYETAKNLPRLHTMIMIAQVLEIPGDKMFDKKTDDLDMHELSKEYSKFGDIIEELKGSKELREFARYYKRNKEKLEGINLVNALETLSKIPKNKK